MQKVLTVSNIFIINNGFFQHKVTEAEVGAGSIWSCCSRGGFPNESDASRLLRVSPTD